MEKNLPEGSTLFMGSPPAYSYALYEGHREQHAYEVEEREADLASGSVVEEADERQKKERERDSDADGRQGHCRDPRHRAPGGGSECRGPMGVQAVTLCFCHLRLPSVCAASHGVRWCA
jgi:hypothetical protein